MANIGDYYNYTTELRYNDSSELSAALYASYYYLTDTPKFSQIVGSKALHHIPEFNYPFYVTEVKRARRLFYNLFYCAISEFFCDTKLWLPHGTYYSEKNVKSGWDFLRNAVQFFEIVDESVIAELTDDLGEIYVDILLTNHKLGYDKYNYSVGIYHMSAPTDYPEHYATILKQLKPLEVLIRLSV